MDVWLLGAAAVVLIAITLWIVWPTPAADAATSTSSASASARAGATGSTPVSRQETRPMMPQGDTFEDQYTSATADLSAGAVATALAAEGEPVARGAAVEPGPPAAVARTGGEPWSATTTAWEQAHLHVDDRPASAPSLASQSKKTIGLGAAALLTLGGAIGGALVYARWQRRRNAPLNRLRRRLVR